MHVLGGTYQVEECVLDISFTMEMVEKTLIGKKKYQIEGSCYLVMAVYITSFRRIFR